jgi:hypothetical protein
MVHNIIHGFTDLLLKYRMSINTTHLFLSIDFVQIETIYIRAFVSSQKVWTIFRCPKRYLQRSILEFIAI